MKRTRLWISIVLLSALLVSAVVMWSPGVSQEAPPIQTTAQSQATTASEDGTSGPAIARAGESPPARSKAERATYFPLGADPATVIADLAPKAQAGDMAAACRVALERLACEQVIRRGREMLEQLLTVEQQALARARSAGTPEMGRLLAQRADRLATLQVRLLERQRACSNVPEANRSEGVDWLRQSALAGHSESILRYALGQSLGIIEGLEVEEARRFDFMGHPGFAAWQREAPSLLHRMLAEGRPEAAFFLALAYSDDATPLNGLIRDDPAEAAAMRLVLGDFRQTPSAYDPLRGLDGRRRQAAIARHAALRDTLSRRAMDRRLLNQGSETPWLALSPDAGYTAPPCRN